MKAEYVKISHPEKVFGASALMQSEINILTMIQKYHAYMDFRKKELSLKIELKKNLDGLKDAIHALDRSLPHSAMVEESGKKEKIMQEIKQNIIKEEPKAQEKALSIEEQIAKIRSKLAKLG